MRTLTFIPLAVLLSSAAFAAPQEEQQTQPAMSEIQVQGTMPVYKLQPEQISEVKGHYLLDNGAIFSISNQGKRLYAQLGERGVTELVAVGDNQFVAPAQNMTVKYVPLGFGDQVVLTYPADLNVASSPMVTVTLAAN